MGMAEKRLIDAFKSEIMNRFIELCRGNDYNKLTLLRIGETIDRIYEKYSTQPTVDAVEVVHGRWETVSSMLGYLCCSQCKDVYIWETWLGDGKWNYCPNCGAKMDGERKDNENR